MESEVRINMLASQQDARSIDDAICPGSKVGDCHASMRFRRNSFYAKARASLNNGIHFNDDNQGAKPYDSRSRLENPVPKIHRPVA